MKFVHRFCTLI